MLLHPVLVTLALLAAEPAKAEPPKTDPARREGAVDWEGQVIKATGSGAPDMRSLSPAQARLGAEKAAQLDAFRNLIAQAKGIRISSDKTVGEVMAKDEVKGRVEGVVKGFKVVKKRYYSDQGVEMDVEVPLSGIAQAVLEPARGAGRGAAAAKTTDGRYTGLLVDARGLGVQPVLAPRLLDASGKVLYAAEMMGTGRAEGRGAGAVLQEPRAGDARAGARGHPAAGQGAEGAGLGPGPGGGRRPRARAALLEGPGRGPGGDRPMRNSRRAAALLLALALAPAWAAEKVPPVVTKEAEGEAAIVGGNVDRAAREAKEAALRSAVEQVAGVLVSSQSLAVNSQLVSDQVYSHSAGYVRSYEVLSQTTERGVVKVKVRAQVGTAELDRDLQAVQALVRRLQGRKLVVLLQEQTIDEKGVTTTSGVTATVLTDAFKRDGWTVIDPSFAAGKVRVSSAVALGATEAKENRHPEQGRLHPLRHGGLPRRPPGRHPGPARRAALGLPADRRLRPRRLRDLGRRAAGEGVGEAPERDVERERELARGERLQPGQGPRGGDHRRRCGRRSSSRSGPRSRAGRASWSRCRTRATSPPCSPSGSS